MSKLSVNSSWAFWWTFVSVTVLWLRKQQQQQWQHIKERKGREAGSSLSTESAGWKSSTCKQSPSTQEAVLSINQQHTRSRRIRLVLRALSLWCLHVLLMSSRYPSVLLPPVDWGAPCVSVGSGDKMDPGVLSRLFRLWLYTGWKSLGKMSRIFSDNILLNEGNLGNSVVRFPRWHTFLS